MNRKAGRTEFRETGEKSKKENHQVERHCPLAPGNYWRPVQRAPVGPCVVEMKHPRKSHPIVCLSMPRSLEWQETHDQRKSQLYENKDDGKFWYLLFFQN
ncbi:hypothetical protein J1605_012092 [Eschrichtius robustus]|uniref:Uncharacterized protein n=1 Tax=Eschrichtius robustus TaxID=9764 RepID=A0AB34GKW7_ESCRO|nr:hypothetical protein J1605_012092 [Eschrichtius robustus]